MVVEFSARTKDRSSAAITTPPFHDNGNPQPLKEMSLRTPGAIVLVSCYELGHQPPGIASTRGSLEAAGFPSDIMDVSVEDLNTEKVRRARFVGISVPMHTALRLGTTVAERVRTINRGCHISFFGLYASLNADYLLDRLADSVIGGEFETPLVLLLEQLDAGGVNAIDGVSRKARPSSPFLKRQRFSVPDRRGFPQLGRYARLEWNGTMTLVGYVEASRGCLHLCLHCPIPPVYNGRFFVVPKEIVLTDIRGLVEQGARHITFGDPDFLNAPTHSLKILRAMHEAFPGLTFDFTAKIEHILQHRNLFDEFASLGCIFIVTAVESLSDNVLANLEKGHRGADVYRALTILRESGIAFRPTWVAFTPWTTIDDYIGMLSFVETNGLIDHVDPVQYAIRLLVPPGSSLLARESIHQFLGPLDQSSFMHPWKHPDARMDRLYDSVRQVVAANVHEDPFMNFSGIRAAAHEVRGDNVSGVMNIPAPGRSRPPRLTEPWFCCAEPTTDQLRNLHSSPKDDSTDDRCKGNVSGLPLHIDEPAAAF